MSRQEPTVVRTFAFIDGMQPQTAARLATSSEGDTPTEGVSDLWIEISPGNDIHTLSDVALKAADVRPSFLIIERQYGLLEIHADDIESVHAAGRAVLDHLRGKDVEFLRPEIVSSMVISNVHAYQAQLLNQFRKGALLMPGSSLLVMEVTPAGWIPLAVNEAEKHAAIVVVDLRAVGQFGRLFLSGTDSEVMTAQRAATEALESHLPQSILPELK